MRFYQCFSDGDPLDSNRRVKWNPWVQIYSEYGDMMTSNKCLKIQPSSSEARANCRALVTVIILVVPIVALAQSHETTRVDFCAFEIPDWATRANLSGVIVVRFYVDESGTPEGIEVVRSLLGDRLLVPFESVEECVSRWRFPNLADGTGVATSWRWEHGTGWVTLSVVPDYGPSLTLQATGWHSAYCHNKSEDRR